MSGEKADKVIRELGFLSSGGTSRLFWWDLGSMEDQRYLMFFYLEEQREKKGRKLVGLILIFFSRITYIRIIIKNEILDTNKIMPPNFFLKI